MYDESPAEDFAATLLERRWFAADRAAARIRAECNALAEVVENAQAAWRSSRVRLCELEALRDALGDALAAGNEPATPSPGMTLQRSAA
jgi:hypothetical protein